MKCLVIDVSKCIGCYNCQITCKDEHTGNDWMPYARPQPETGHFWMKVNEYERGSIPKIKVDWIPLTCMHCEDAPCITACDSGAIYNRDDGIIIIDPAKCKGSRRCLDACPYGVIYFNDEYRIAQKCTLCAHLLDEGWEEPRCVRACPAEALKFGEYEELEGLIKKGEIMPALGSSRTVAKANVYYIGLPKRFIAGEVYSPSEDICLEGVDVVVTEDTAGTKSRTKTNNYGDFWLDKLEAGVYHLAIEKEGYYPKEIKNINTEQDVNLGEIKLYKRI